MNNTILKYINDLFDSYDLFSGKGKKKTRASIKRILPNISEEGIKEVEDYLDEFYEYCLKFAGVLADKYKTPFLPNSEDAQKEIAEYVTECQKQYPDIDEEHIVSIFSTACWLTNR